MADRFRAGKRLWNPDDDDAMRRWYPDLSNREIARRLRRTLVAVNARADKLRLHKSAAYLASPDACRLRRGDHVGAAYRFKKGQTPLNKGLRRPGYHRGRMKETQFKKGESRNRMPIGATRLMDGYVYLKVAAVPHVAYTVNWLPLHILNWERAHGRPLPGGHCLWFRDGDRLNVAVSNLELITRAENMRAQHRSQPPEADRAIRTAAGLADDAERPRRSDGDAVLRAIAVAAWLMCSCARRRSR